MIPSEIGPYQILGKLGEGGFGIVYEAIHRPIERRVAIKILHAEYAKHPDMAQRFFNEARAVNLVKHPSLVQISDFGQLPDGSTYLVMEYLAGETLGQRLRSRGGAVAIPEALGIAVQIADGLAAAHAKAIIHRDLKPANIMLVADVLAPGGERVKLLDFGIAKFTDAAADWGQRTGSDMIMGSPLYMSPEQCRSFNKVTEKSDVYSLGVLLFELLAGKPPFQAEAPGDLMVMHLRDVPPRVRFLNANVSVQLADVVDRLLDKQPERRPSMIEIRDELLRFWQGHAEKAAGPPRHEPAHARTQHTQTLRLTRGKHRVLLVAACGLLFSSALFILGAVLAPKLLRVSADGKSAELTVQSTSPLAADFLVGNKAETRPTQSAARPLPALSKPRAFSNPDQPKRLPVQTSRPKHRSDPAPGTPDSMSLPERTLPPGLRPETLKGFKD